jgi:hypothetical protein
MVDLTEQFVPTSWRGTYTRVVSSDRATGSWTISGGGPARMELTRWPTHSIAPNVTHHSLSEPGDDTRTYRWVAHGWNWFLRASTTASGDTIAALRAELPTDSPILTLLLQRAELPAPDPTGGRGTVRIFDGQVPVDYGQFHVITPGSDAYGDLQGSFVGQENGLCGAAHEGFLSLISGTHYGTIPVVVDLASSAPEIDTARWEEIVEVPFACLDADGVSLCELWGEEQLPIPLQPGLYRVRYCVSGMDGAHQGEAVDNYALTFWPAPRRADEIMVRTSEAANYWHSAWVTQ